MSKRQKETKMMSFSDISKRMTTGSQVCEKSSTLVSNPSNVTGTEQTHWQTGYTCRTNRNKLNKRTHINIKYTKIIKLHINGVHYCF